MKRVFLATLLAATVAAPILAGCISPAGTSIASSPEPLVIPPDWATTALPWGNGHDHRDWSQHTGLSTANFKELGYDPLFTDYYNKTAGGYYCGGGMRTSEDRRLAVVSSFTTGVAFVLVDVTDPAHPEKVGEYVLTRTMDYDVDITPDGKHVVIAADVSTGERAPSANLPLLAASERVQPMFRDACTNELRLAGPERDLPLWPSTILVGIQDPRNPTLEDVAPAPVIGPHSVSTARVHDKVWVASSTTNLVHQVSYFEFFQVVETPVGGKLVLQSIVDSGQYGATAISNGHVDAEIAEHPVTHHMVAYLSNWDGGLVILDLEIPQAPTLLSTWIDKGTDGGVIHSTRSVQGLWDGKHYVLAGQEFVRHPTGRPSGWVYVIDDTDPTHPKEVARWTLPVNVDPSWGGIELFSTHYFRIIDRTLFVAMYHGGLWAVDLSGVPNVKAPPSIGVFVPDQRAPKGPPAVGTYAYAPFVLDVFPYPDYHVVIFDGLSGAYSLQFDPTNPAPSPPPWPVP
ncbi:MAG: hypothetical protein WDA16_06745 [Candidatus Thermoplasmatota archaeon]